jgi:alpha-beta hydrolase superfamily lysophospholipase
VIITGYLHRPSNPAVTAGNYPANQDPKFQGLGLDNEYLTSRPGVRGASFHSSSSDPAVVAYDESQKDIVSRTGLLDFLGQRGVAAANNVSNRVTVPVLVVNGQQDAIFCYDASFNCADLTAVTANETPFYAAAKSFKLIMIPSSGHDLVLHPSANDSFKAIDQWIKAN